MLVYFMATLVKIGVAFPELLKKMGFPHPLSCKPVTFSDFVFAQGSPVILLVQIIGEQYYYAFSSVTVTFLWLPEGYKEVRTQEDNYQADLETLEWPGLKVS